MPPTGTVNTAGPSMANIGAVAAVTTATAAAATSAAAAAALAFVRIAIVVRTCACKVFAVPLVVTRKSGRLSAAVSFFAAVFAKSNTSGVLRALPCRSTEEARFLVVLYGRRLSEVDFMQVMPVQDRATSVCL